jgi:AraC family transcriptional activator of mtrCDE
MGGQSAAVPASPLVRISQGALNVLMKTLEVRVVHLSECLVAPGWRLELQAPKAPGIHYSLRGSGRAVFAGVPPISVGPHTLVIVPGGWDFALEATGHVDASEPRIKSSPPAAAGPLGVRRHVAGEAVDADDALIVICGYFEATYGATIDLFERLSSPIVEQFDDSEQLDHTLRAALDELLRQEVGDGAMATALMKQVMVTLLRRSLTSSKTWVERFAILGDPAVSRAFSAMADNPGADHTVACLAQASGLSRSAFMHRFSKVFGKPPMGVLRDLRMRLAAQALLAQQSSIDEIAFEAGYKERTGFNRAFRKIYGCEPAEYRAAATANPADAGL